MTDPIRQSSSKLPVVKRVLMSVNKLLGIQVVDTATHEPTCSYDNNLQSPTYFPGKGHEIVELSQCDPISHAQEVPDNLGLTTGKHTPDAYADSDVNAKMALDAREENGVKRYSRPGQTTKNVVDTRDASHVNGEETPLQQARRHAREYYDACVGFERQRDEWKRLFHEQARGHMSAQVTLEHALTTCRVHLGQLVKYVNELRKEKSLEPIKLSFGFLLDGAPIGEAKKYLESMDELMQKSAVYQGYEEELELAVRFMALRQEQILFILKVLDVPSDGGYLPALVEVKKRNKIRMFSKLVADSEAANTLIVGPPINASRPKDDEK